MEMAITELRVSEGDRTVTIRREESSGVKDMVAVYWRLTDGTRTVGMVPDAEYDAAPKLACSYLERMAEADALRAKADAIEATVLQEFRVVDIVA